jgi:2'-5' RNA ligase
MRAFVAIELPPPLRVEVGARVGQVRDRLPAARWVAAANYHATLVFLGEIDSNQRARLEDRLPQAFGSRRRPFTLGLGRVGAFPSPRQARVLWLGLEAGPELGELQEHVARICADVLGASEKRRFHAHVTLARCRKPWRPADLGSLEDALQPLAGAPVPVERGVLMRSSLTPEGARYEVLAAFALGGSA